MSLEKETIPLALGLNIYLREVMKKTQKGPQEPRTFPTVNAERQYQFVQRQLDQGRKARRLWLTDGEFDVLKRRLGGKAPTAAEDPAPGTTLFPTYNTDRVKGGGANGLVDVLKAFKEAPEPIDYVLPNMVAGSVGALVSPGGTGKSMFALQLAVQIAGGPDLLGSGMFLSGSVVYLPAEDPPIALNHRLYALGRHISPKLRETVANNLLIQPLVGTRPNLLDSQWFDSLLRVASGKRLIILDTLRRFHGEEENASGPMSLVIGRMEAIASETGCTILFVHHTSKMSTLHGMGDQQQASRGSSVLVDNVRWQGYLSSMTSGEAEEWGVSAEERALFVKFGVCKVNYGSPFQDRWYKRSEGGVLMPTSMRGRFSVQGSARAKA